MRDKLIELISRVQDFGIKRTNRLAHPKLPRNEEIADHLIANGVIIATDNNVGHTRGKSVFVKDVLELLERNRAYMTDVGYIHAKSAVLEALEIDRSE